MPLQINQDSKEQNDMKTAKRRTADTHAAEITQATAPEQLTQLENAAKIANAKK